MFAPMPSESLWIGGWSWGLTTAGSKENKEAAWELLKWMSSTKEGARSELEHFGWISGIKDHPALMEQLPSSPPLQAAYEVLQNAKKLPPQIPVDYGAEFDSGYQQVMNGELEPKAFLDHITEYVNKLLSEKYGQ
jgi:ABC-type glycerol-3-phosphate transport system substrate-binding protein